MKKKIISTALVITFLIAAAYTLPAASGGHTGKAYAGSIISAQRPPIPFEHVIVFTFAELYEGYLHYIEEKSYRYEAFALLHPDKPFCRIIALVNANVDLPSYTNVQIAEDPYCIAVITNHHFGLPHGWSPSDLVNVGGGHLLREEAAEMFLLMREAMSEENLTVVIVSTYRNYWGQSYLFSRAVSEQGRFAAEMQFARPGHSEHQTGLALDILQRHVAGVLHDARFANTPQFEWLTQNAHMFGFIQRYPESHRHIHRFVAEPWHWRYVGVCIATAMFESDIATFEEFYGRYLIEPVRQRHQREERLENFLNTRFCFDFSSRFYHAFFR